MINKLTLNNEIVAMRTIVRQARIHVIRRLIREMKKLRESNGDDAVKAKCKRKADRKADELSVLKKLKPDVVSKFALKNSENAADKFADPNTGIEERALFRLISSKVMVERVSQFRARYPDWEEFINEALEKLGANRKKNFKKPVKLSDKSINIKNKYSTPEKSNREESSSKKVIVAKASAANVLDESHVIKDEVDVTVPKNIRSSKLNVGWVVEDMKPMQKVRGSKKVKEFVKKDRQTKVENKKSLPIHDKPNSSKVSWNVATIVNKKGAAEVRKFSEFIGTSHSVPDREERLSKTEDEPDVGGSPNEEEVDPFFVGSDGRTEYRTSIKAMDDDHGDKDSAQPWRRENKPFDREWRGSKGESFNGRGHPSRGRGHPSGDRGNPSRGRGRPSRGRGEFGRDGHFNRDRESQKEGRGPRFGGRGESWGNDKIFKKSPGPSSDTAHLHPSWEAKRKQKEQSISNVVFQGKKIKFDDDD